MAELYKQLQRASSNYEERPIGKITKQKIDESLYIIRGKDQGHPAWHYILVPVSAVAALKAQRPGETIDITKFGRLIEYQDRKKNLTKASGWGIDPPKLFQLWIEDQYETASISADINLKYTEDDIRLCTMQRATPKQKLGVHFCCYDKDERFHYIKLTEGLTSTLAIRSGIKHYDRIISFNGVNIENATQAQFMERFEAERHLPVEMLVCTPATYLHYRETGKPLHSDLRTVQRLEPVYASSITDSDTDVPVVSFDAETFCAVRWDNNDTITIVPQSAICKSPKFTSINDICFVKARGQYQKGKITFTGSYDDCKKLTTNSISHLTTKVSDKLMRIFHGKTQNSTMSTTHLRSDSTVQKHTPQVSTRSHTHRERCMRLEELPNELFLLIFTYLDFGNLFNAFWGLNTRLDSIFRSYKHLCFTVDDKTNESTMKSYASLITQLIIDTLNACDLTQYSNLQSLILCSGDKKHLQQLRPSNLPNLTRLSFLLGSKFSPSIELVRDIFSNAFPSLYHVNLGRVQDLDVFTPNIAPSLRFVSIRCSQPLIVSCILASCPKLDHLQLHVFEEIQNNIFCSPPSNHPLRRFTLWSDSVPLTLSDIDVLLTNTPNVAHFYLQTITLTPFFDFANVLVNRLDHLYRFDCHVKEMIKSDRRTVHLSNIHRLHWSFNRIECKEKDEDFCTFITK